MSQRIFDLDASRKGPLTEAVRAHVKRMADAAPLSPALRHLAATPSGLVVTLNYDSLIERAAREAGRDAISLDLAQAMQFVGAGGGTAEVLRVVHLHGSTDDDTSPLVLANAEYGQMLSDDRVGHLFAALTFRYHLLVVGTSLAEPHVLQAMQVLRHTPPRHVLVCEQRVAERIAAGDPAAPVTPSHGISVCSYPNDQHGVLDGFLERLVTQGTFRASRISTAPAVDTLYVSRKLLRTDDVDDPQIALLLDKAEVVDELELAVRPRTVVIGAAGSGKSSLCAQLRAGSLSETVVVVPLRRVTELIGPPEFLLESWLPSARPQVDVAVADVISGERPVHLVLDGLDELVPRRREAAVQAINRLGGALPHARITVTTRPAAAVSAFAEGWQHFELLCDADWQQSFLELAQTSLTDVQARLGAAAESVKPLLSIPFYLRRLSTPSSESVSRAVRSGDVTDVILALFDDLLASDETLKPIASGLREWLTDCAVLMQLSGVRQFGLGTLIELSRDVELGDVEEIAQRLSARSLLQDTQETWTFEHRLFAEALVADRIRGDDPAIWLDVVAPVIDGRGVVREDWLEIVRLVASRSSRWRAALRTRDPVVAARSTPQDAAESERIAAIWELWNHSARLQVWIEGRYDGGDDDGSHIGRIVPSPPPDDFVEEVERCLHRGTRYDRANAMEVLVRLFPKRASDLLAESLRSERDSTVRRSSASWVRRLGLIELRTLIADRAANFEDEAEAGDMASIALSLAPAHERLNLARRLRRAGNRELRDYYVLNGVPPGDQVKWMLEEARDDPDEAEFIAGTKIADVLAAWTDPKPEEAADVAELALVANTPPSASLLVWLAEHRIGAAAGVVRVVRGEDAMPYFVHRVASAVGSTALRDAGAPDDLVQRVSEAEALREEAARTVAPDLDDGHEVVIPPQPEGLADVLDRPRDEVIHILARDQRIHIEHAGRARPDTIERLHELIESLWGQRDLRSAVTHVAADRVTIKRWAGLTLSYGPASAFPLSNSRWVQAALTGWLFEPQYKWLRASLSEDRLRAAVNDAPFSVRVVNDLLRIAPSESLAIVAPLVARLPDSELVGSRATMLFETLANIGLPGELRMLFSRGGEIATRAAPLLARAGDVEAQRALLDELRSTLAAGAHVDHHDHPWVDAISDTDLLPDLLETYVAANLNPQESSPFDIGRGILAAIQRIGGLEAIRAVEDLAGSGRWAGIQWLHRTVDDMLQVEASAAAASAAEALRLELNLPKVSSVSPF
ncbi:MAG TPA: SIR2 family protein [Solirubrobacteraceae bacterium]|nr:SIR2 family protein [Solirubrobacteraceae bacterium]